MSWNKLFGNVYGEGDPNTPPTTDPKPEDKKFSQDDLNRILAEERRKHQDKLKKLEETASKYELTEKEKKELASQFEEFKKQFMTKEELAKQEAEKQATAHKTQVDELTADRNNWQSLFTSRVAKADIATAAVKHKAFSASQLELMLAPRVKVVPVMNKEGKPTGDYQAVYPMAGKDGDMIDVPVIEAVGKLRENEEFANLFLADGTPGTGLNTLNNSPGQSGSTSGPPTDPAAYRAWRQKQQKNGNL